MLENVPLFSGLAAEALAEVELHGSVKSFKKNAIIINQDDETYSLYVILSGRVKVFVSGEDGREAVLNHQVAGDYFGDLARFYGGNIMDLQDGEEDGVQLFFRYCF